MRRNSFGKRLTLLTLNAATGRQMPEVTDTATVWADISEPGVTTKLTALSAGQEISLTARMWRSEYMGYTHAEYGGRRYKIVETGSTENPLHIKLLLSRG